MYLLGLLGAGESLFPHVRQQGLGFRRPLMVGAPAPPRSFEDGLQHRRGPAQVVRAGLGSGGDACREAARRTRCTS